MCAPWEDMDTRKMTFYKSGEDVVRWEKTVEISGCRYERRVSCIHRVSQNDVLGGGVLCNSCTTFVRLKRAAASRRVCVGAKKYSDHSIILVQSHKESACGSSRPVVTVAQRCLCSFVEEEASCTHTRVPWTYAYNPERPCLVRQPHNPAAREAVSKDPSFPVLRRLALKYHVCVCSQGSLTFGGRPCQPARLYCFDGFF